MERRKNKSYWVILILLFIIFICSFLLYRNMTAGAIENDNEIIGTLTFKHKTIERKFDSDVIWAKIESGLVIRNKDTIRSGDFSDAVLTLKDDTKININENSMIYLDISNNDINLNFAYGSMSLSKNNEGDSAGVTVKIKSGSNTVEVKNSDLVLEKKGKEDLSLQVQNGTAKLNNGKEEKDINKNELVKLNNSQIEISEVNLSLISPEDASIISDNSNSIPVKFQWAAEKSSKLKLEISLDSRFKNILKSYNVSGSDFTANLNQGNYYWRIASVSNKKKKEPVYNYSSFRKLTVYTTSPPTIVSPKMNTVFSFSNLSPLIAITWNRLDTSKNYKVEISRNSNFSEIVKTINSTQTTVNVDNLEIGKYFTRVIAFPFREEFKVSTSDAISFSLEKKGNLDPPILVIPRESQEINGIVFSKSGFLFQTKDNAEIKEYIFQISSNSNFANIKIEKTSNSNQIRIQEDLDNGKYYWRVLGVATNGQKTPFSDIRSFQIREELPIELVAPKNNSNLEMNEKPISFRWNRLAYKANFQIEVSDSPDLKQKLHSNKTNDNFSSFSFSKEGTYYWQIISLAEDNSVLSKSPIHSFQIFEVHELIPLFPTSNSKVDMSPLDSLDFKWKQNPKVESYYFELHNSSGSTIAKVKTKNNYYTFRNLSKLDEGNFNWTLQESIDTDGKNQLGKKVATPFKIYLSAKPGTPEIKTPKKMYVE